MGFGKTIDDRQNIGVYVWWSLLERSFTPSYKHLSQTWQAFQILVQHTHNFNLLHFTKEKKKNLLLWERKFFTIMFMCQKLLLYTKDA